MSFFKKLFGNGRKSIMDWKAFTEYLASKFVEQLDEEITIVWGADIESTKIKIIASDGFEKYTYLANFYAEYVKNPDNLDEIVRYSMEPLTNKGKSNSISSAHILPVVKDLKWLEDSSSQLKETMQADISEVLITEPLAADLVLTYVIDDENNMRYLSPQEAAGLGLEEQQLSLRELATSNFFQYAAFRANAYLVEDDIQLYQFVLDGIYDSSLLLFIGEMSNSLNNPLKGNPVIAVPSRNRLLVCGSEDQVAIEAMKKWVQKISEEETYLISPKLYLLENGNIRLFQVQ